MTERVGLLDLTGLRFDEQARGIRSVRFHVSDVERGIAFGTLKVVGRDEVRLQAIVTKEVFAAGVNRQDRSVAAISAHGRSVDRGERAS